MAQRGATTGGRERPLLLPSLLPRLVLVLLPLMVLVLVLVLLLALQPVRRSRRLRGGALLPHTGRRRTPAGRRALRQGC